MDIHASGPSSPDVSAPSPVATPASHVDDALRRRGRAPLARHLGWFGFGVSVAAFVALVRAGVPAPAPAGPAVLWAVDRDGHELVGLDRDLLVAKSVHVDWPLEVECTGDGGTWVLRSGNGQAGTSVRLDRFDADGVLITQLYLEDSFDLDVLDGEQALLIERASTGPRVLRVRTEGSWYPVSTDPRVTCVSGSRGTVLVGTNDGAVMRVDPSSGAILAQVQLDGHVGDLVRGPTPGSCWALDTQGTGRLFLLDENLAVRWAVGVGYESRHVAPVPGEERAWVADVNSPRVRRFGPSAVIELDHQGLPTAGLDRVVPWRNGGALLVAPGALVHLTAQGALAPGQGGFAWLGDADRIR